MPVFIGVPGGLWGRKQKDEGQSYRPTVSQVSCSLAVGKSATVSGTVDETIFNHLEIEDIGQVI